MQFTVVSSRCAPCRPRPRPPRRLDEVPQRGAAPADEPPRAAGRRCGAAVPWSHHGHSRFHRESCERRRQRELVGQARAGPDHRRRGRRPQRHRDLLAGRRAARLRRGCPDAVHLSADGGHPARERAHRARHRARAGRGLRALLPQMAGGRAGPAAAHRQRHQPRRRPQRHGRLGRAGAAGPACVVRGGLRRRVAAAAGSCPTNATCACSSG